MGIKDGAASRKVLESQSLLKILYMTPADGNLGCFFVFHFQQITPREPWDDFPDMDQVDQIRPVGTKERLKLELFCQIFHGICGMAEK